VTYLHKETMKTIYQEASDIVKIRIGENSFQSVYQRLNVSGQISQKQIYELIFLLLKRVEDLEKQIYAEHPELTQEGVENVIKTVFEEALKGAKSYAVDKKTQIEANNDSTSSGIGSVRATNVPSAAGAAQKGGGNKKTT